jgi:hypothetical protein
MWVSKEEVEDYGFFASWYSLFLLFFSFLTSFWDLSFIVVDNMFLLCIVLVFFFEGGYYNSVLLCMGWI